MTEEKEVATEKNGQENSENKEVDSELDSAVIRQVEYYFSDINLPRDKFLREQVKLDDGWIPLDILTRFNRLAKLSTDIDAIANALNNSTSGLLEVSEDNKKVRRNPELPIPEMNEERRKEMMARTVYAKGFPKEAVLDDILKYFKQYDEVENIIMRKYLERSSKKRIFKGSVFATFKTKEQVIKKSRKRKANNSLPFRRVFKRKADKFMETKDLKYEDTPLITFWQDVYLQQKQEEYMAKKEKKDKKHKDDKGDKEDFKLPRGTVFHFSEGEDKMKREDVKDALVALGAEVAYIDFKVGDTEGWVRLAKENSAKEISEKITDGKIKIGEKEVVFKLLEDEEEKAYLVKTAEEMVKRRKNQKNNSRQNKGKYKGNRQGRKRRHEHHDDGPASKVKADDS